MKRDGYVIFPGQGASVGGRDGYSVPEKFSARIESLQAQRTELPLKQNEKAWKRIPRGHSCAEASEKKPRAVTGVNVYLAKGWKYEQGEYPQHMIELSYSRNVTNEDITIELRKTARCYCTDCLDLESYGRDDDQMLPEILKLRKTVAEANGIPLDGTDKHEAQIDAVLAKGESDVHQEAQG